MSAEAEESEAHKGAQSKLQSLVNSLVDQKTGAIASVDDARRLHDAMKEEMSLMGRLVLAEVVKTSAQSEEGCERLKPLVEEGLLATIIQWVEEAQQDSKHMTIPRFLEVLESLPVTLRALQESNAGSTVNRLRKCSFNDDRLKDTQRKVQQSAAAIVKKWRALAQQSSSEERIETGKRERDVSDSVHQDAERSEQRRKVRKEEQEATVSSSQDDGSQGAFRGSTGKETTSLRNDLEADEKGQIFEAGDDADVFGKGLQQSKRAHSARGQSLRAPETRSTSSSGLGSNPTGVKKGNLSQASSSSHAGSAKVQSTPEPKVEPHSSKSGGGAELGKSAVDDVIMATSKQSGGSDPAPEPKRRANTNKTVTFAPAGSLEQIVTFQLKGDEGRSPVPPEMEDENGGESSSKEGKGSRRSKSKQRQPLQPERLDVPRDWQVGCGEKSTEYGIQQARRKRERKVTYKNSSQAPPSPAEPTGDDAGVFSAHVNTIPAIAVDAPQPQQPQSQAPQQPMPPGFQGMTQERGQGMSAGANASAPGTSQDLTALLKSLTQTIQGHQKEQQPVPPMSQGSQPGPQQAAAAANPLTPSVSAPPAQFANPALLHGGMRGAVSQPQMNAFSGLQGNLPFVQQPPQQQQQNPQQQQQRQMRSRAPMCKFFNTPQGCKHGDKCKYQHVRMPNQEHQQQSLVQQQAPQVPGSSMPSQSAASQQPPLSKPAQAAFEIAKVAGGLPGTQSIASATGNGNPMGAAASQGGGLANGPGDEKSQSANSNRGKRGKKRKAGRK